MWVTMYTLKCQAIIPMHCFQCCAVLDHIDFSGLSDYQEEKEISAYTLLPISEDLKMIKYAFEVVVSR